MLNNEEKCEELTQFVSANKMVFEHVIFELAVFYLLLDGEDNKGSKKMYNKLEVSDCLEYVNIDIEHLERTAQFLSKLSEYVSVT